MRILRNLLLIVPLAAAPAIALDDDAQAWLVPTGQGHVAPHVRFFVEVQPRLALPGLAADRVIGRGAIGRDLSPSTSVWVGYGWVPQYADTTFGGGFRSEHRGYLPRAPSRTHPRGSGPRPTSRS